MSPRTCDMRGAVASMIYGAKIMKQAGLFRRNCPCAVRHRHGRRLRRPPILHMVQEEGSARLRGHRRAHGLPCTAGTAAANQ